VTLTPASIAGADEDERVTSGGKWQGTFGTIWQGK
jgi:hypothetical protein